MKHSILTVLVLVPALSGCLAGGYAPTGSFSPAEQFPAMGPQGNGVAGPGGQAAQGASYGGQPYIQVQPQPQPLPSQRSQGYSQMQPVGGGYSDGDVNGQSAGMDASSQNPARPVVGWGGDIVRAPAGGSISAANPTHGLGPNEKGRMQILELYQGVIDERDALSDEVFSLRSELSHRDQMLKRSDDGSNELLVEIAKLKSDKKLLGSEIEELLARLTTAQIRRLEAEKLVLEARIIDFTADAGTNEKLFTEGL